MENPPSVFRMKVHLFGAARHLDAQTLGSSTWLQKEQASLVKLQ